MTATGYAYSVPVTVTAEFVAHEQQVAIAVGPPFGPPMPLAPRLVLEAQSQIGAAELARRRNLAVQPIPVDPRAPFGLPADRRLEPAVACARDEHDIRDLPGQPRYVQPGTFSTMSSAVRGAKRVKSAGV